MTDARKTAVHPFLDTNSLKSLPLVFRRRAYAALDATQGQKALLLFCGMAKHLPVENILPVLYANLSESEPPSATDLAQSLDDGIAPPAPKRASIALIMLSDRVDDIPSSLAPYLWPVVWRWAEFLFSNYQCVADLDEISVGLPLAAILRPLFDDPATAAVINQTPGVRTVIAQSWMHALQSKDKATTVAALDVAYMLARADARYAQHSAELIEGAGSVSNLAYMIVRLMVLCMPPTSENPSGERKYAFDGVSVILRKLLQDPYLAMNLIPALISHNISTALFAGMKCALIGGVTFELAKRTCPAQTNLYPTCLGKLICKLAS
ncbi:hypothetical protein C8F01DRAFT_1274915, partial [Mycena amicta]